MRATPAAITIMGLVAGSAHAWASESFKGEISLERHHTSNALDSGFALPDFYLALRGSLERAVDLGSTRVTFGAAGHAIGYDRYKIEDDRALGLTVAAERKFGERVEMRGTLSWKLASEGDDLEVEDTIIGIRTVTETMAAALQSGIDLGMGMVANIEAGMERETPRRTYFEAEVIDPLLLTPRKDRFQLGAKLTRTTGALAVGVLAGSELIVAGRQPDAPYSYDLAHHRAIVDARWTKKRVTVEVAFGLEQLRGAGGGINMLRPAYAAAASYRFADGSTLRASVAANFDTRNTDDPVATRYARQELGLTMPLAARLTLGIGLYNSWRDYITLGGGEHARGLFASADYKLSEKVSLVIGADLSRRDLTEEGRINMTDLRAALRAAL